VGVDLPEPVMPAGLAENVVATLPSATDFIRVADRVEQEIRGVAQYFGKTLNEGASMPVASLLCDDDDEDD